MRVSRHSDRWLLTHQARGRSGATGAEPCEPTVDRPRIPQGVLGLVYVDFKTQKRIPKLSAQWFREAAAHNAVV